MLFCNCKGDNNQLNKKEVSMKQAIIRKNKYWRGFRKSPTNVILVASLNDTDLIKKISRLR
jgi:hypothetical protein